MSQDKDCYGKILFVEDNKILRTAVKRYLSLLNIDFDVASSGNETLYFVQKNYQFNE